MLVAVAEPATTAVELKELIEDSITTFERAKTVLCTPAGNPTCSIRFAAFLSRHKHLKSRCNIPVSLVSARNTRMAEIY